MFSLIDSNSHRGMGTVPQKVILLLILAGFIFVFVFVLFFSMFASFGSVFVSDTVDCCWNSLVKLFAFEGDCEWYGNSLCLLAV